jgi:hypothetical protein
MPRYLARLLGVLVMLTTGGCGEPITLSLSEGTAEGLWAGSTNTGRTLTAAVLDDGTYYLFYSTATDLNLIAGVVQGTGVSSEGTFSSSDARDFGIGVPVRSATVSATYGVRQFLNGSVTYSGGGALSFSTSYNSAYDTTPPVASLTGVYTGQAGSSGGQQQATVTVQLDGSFTGSEANGCTFTGSATPRLRGNVFDQRITFGGPPCFFAGSTFRGIVFFDAATFRLHAAAPNGARTDAAIFSGIKIL